MRSIEEELRARLADDLRAAMKGREAAHVNVLRSLIAALDNATAVPIDGPRAVVLNLPPEALNAPTEGLGKESTGRSREVPRRVLSPDDVLHVLAVEMAERRNAALALEKHGCYEEAAVVRAELEAIEGYAAWTARCAGGGGALG